MTILQTGFAKSGNMLLHVILRSLLELAGREYRSVICSDPEWRDLKDKHVFNSDLQPTIDVLDVSPGKLCCYMVSSFYRKPIFDLRDYIKNCSIIWTHSAYLEGIFDEIFSMCSSIYIYRDGRSVLNSLAHYISTDYARSNFDTKTSTKEYLADKSICKSILRAWKQNLNGHFKSGDNNILFIKYEDLIDAKRKWAKIIAEHIGVLHFLNEEKLDKVLATSSPQIMRKRMPEHVRECNSTDWKNHFSKELIDLCNHEIGDTLLQLGYEIDGCQQKHLTKTNKSTSGSNKKRLDDKTMLDSEPCDRTDAIKLARKFRLTGKSSKALSLLQKILRHDNDDWTVKYEQGLNLMCLERWGEALEIFNCLAKISDDDVSGIAQQGLALKKLGRLDEALTKIQNAIEIQPDNLNCRIQEALINQEMGRSNESLAILQALEKACPRDITVLRALGGTLAVCGKLREALDVFMGLLERHPDMSELYLNISDVHRFRGRFDEALQAVDRLERINPGSIGIWMTRGKIYRVMNDHKTAHDCFMTEYEITGNRRTLALAEEVMRR